MKITIELPEDLFLQAKRQVLEKGTTLKALMETGLRHILTQSNARSDKPYRISVINHMAQPAAGKGDLNAFIDQMRAEQLNSFLPQ